MVQDSFPIHAPTTRRDFARTAIVAVTAPMLAPLAACASPPRPAPAPAVEPVPVAAPASPVAPSATSQHQEPQRDPQSVHLVEALRARYGARLTDEQWEEVRKGIEGNLRAAKALHDFPLLVEAEPAFVFRAYRGAAR